ncbi:nitrate- and nitrite sensing domain-containing protein [Solwaraspora sp. WMMD406]|uniref:sensor histidine kinase n=1 Tax=Solwaraspora sp. WMMD406 TaxID=3016095 RepID=UPI0024162912|nr:nitrate- and nitrite sensing domain-containing protein [Solwaraspora sp. WMMD406]MDG4767534.1 nitrate- and nitrite sensing domain-containing protein [Solwaraspora sp. WMMD406]
MLLDRLRIRGKLALLVLIPLVAVASLTVPVVVGRVALAGRAADTLRTMQLSGRVGSLIQDLEQERLLLVGHLLGGADRPQVLLQEATVRDRAADIRADLGAELDPELAAAVAAVDGLDGVRAGVLAGSAATDEVMAGYGTVIRRLIDGLRLVDEADVTTSEGRQIVALDAALRLDDAISAGATHMLVVVGERSPAAATQYAMSLMSAQDNASRFGRFATPEQLALYELVENALDQRLGRGFTAQAQSGASDGFDADPTAALAGLTVETLYPSLESLIALGRFVERKIVIDVTVEVARRQQQILLTAYGVVALVLMVLLAVVTLSLIIARSVARPLTRLTSSADRMARIAEAELVRVADDDIETPHPVRLDPVEISATDEIGDLARAFERVQVTAARLVERQVLSRRNVAQMFGHVGRRTQNLVSRQLAIIDRLEREETDPRRLQHLYRLDHVSSRLRRNAGSLVVLSGAGGAEEHMSPLPVSDVVRLALGEIEDYTRVDVQAPAGPAIAPSVIADLVLLLAEVMENGTVFSPPHTRVTVTTVSTGRGLRISVVDRGLGLSERRLADENARLTRRERLDLMPTEVLGLFVVGRLARRHGIDVVLTATPGGGVTVTIDLGPELVVLPPEATRPSQSGQPPSAHTTTSSAVPASAVPASAVPASAVPALPTRLAGFDTAALQRATRTLGIGQPWNAFAAPAGPTSRSTVPTPAIRPAESARSAGEPPPAGRLQLRRRVPGAQHPVGTATSVDQPADQAAFSAAGSGDGPGGPDSTPGGRDGQPTPSGTPVTDPAAARALLEEFEAGVRRAQRQVTQDPTPGGTPRLTQRVPGASLPEPPPSALGSAARQPWPPDPQAAKDAMEEFESGVHRALSEIIANHHHRDDEGIR